MGKFEGKGLDSRYLGYFACFNRQEFYVAHDVLEDLWLECRGGPDADFYKALIQFAGAFVHLQKNRLGPAAALFRLSRSYLSRFPATHLQLDVAGVIRIAGRWLALLEQGPCGANPLGTQACPSLLPLDIGIASSASSR